MTEPTTTHAPLDPASVERFRHVGYDLDLAGERLRLRLRYALDHSGFEETVTVPVPSDGPHAAPESIDAAARLVFLLAGVSYYKAAAPPVVEVPGGLTGPERRLLEHHYRDGLGEFAYRNRIDLSGLVIEADDRDDEPASPVTDRAVHGPLVPFGGGIDSIVTVEGLRRLHPDLALFVVSRGGDRFEAIERAAAVSALPVLGAERSLDPAILRSAQLGYLNGHVPVTGILSAIAALTALVTGRDAVAMSNERSASSGNLEWNGRTVNHQWSKTLEFEGLFREALASSVPGAPDYFSWLRPRSELWVAEQFASLPEYHLVFRSCNRAFHQDPAHRLDRWCGRCDKCAFVDLVCSPFLGAATLATIFDGHEPLDDPGLEATFRTLLGLGAEAKPFECVGDVDECRAAIVLTARRPDRAGTPLVQRLAAEVAAHAPGVDPAALLHPRGPHHIPERYAPPDLLG